ncbi:hypothetical protein LCL95_16110 [Bacillus timonensis]|nr:hypothetical protein [Bacillus timonensis]
MWDINFNIVQFVISILAWGTIGYIAYRIYTKQESKPRIWKIVFVMMVGLFSFSINLPFFDTIIKISILPLGVWILYAVLKGKAGRWEKYRRFAWLGFWANFIFLASTFISIPISYFAYPEDHPATYISDVSNASVVPIHPSAKDESLHKEVIINQLANFERERIINDVWYEETYMNAEPSKQNERFPYLLINVKPKWGSGIKSMIYIENDGKGLLISTADKQYYFRSNSSVLMGGSKDE